MLARFVAPLASACVVLGLAAAAWAAPVTITVNSGRSSLTFTSDAPGERIVGTASQITGTITADLENLAATTGTLQFPVASMATGNTMRDRHMQGAEWLNAAANPNITFTVERLDNAAATTNGNRTDITGTAVGQVTVNGVSVPATAQIEVAWMSNNNSVRIQPRFAVELAAHNVSGAQGSIGDTVAGTITIDGTIYATAE
jgi:polyisoprenoid-binding protein YceI